MLGKYLLFDGIERPTKGYSQLDGTLTKGGN